MVASLVVARIVYAARLRAVIADVPNGGRLKATSTTDPWHDAEQLAASGRFTEAAHSLYRAALVLLATRGLVRVHDSNADMRYVVVPMRPAGTEGWSEERLAQIITRDSLVGVTIPKP